MERSARAAVARSTTNAVRRGAAAITVLSVLIGGPAFAQSASTHRFSVEDQVINQCTGQMVTISLSGRVVVRPSIVDGGWVHSVLSEVHGSADGGDVDYRFTGTETADFESETLAAELPMWANVRVVTRGGQSVYIGYDRQTIRIDESGEIAHVDHQFEFSCD